MAHELVTNAAGHNGMLFVAHGAAGLGKTVLLRELAGAASSTGWNTTLVRADEIEHSEPYSFIERLSASGVAPDWYFTPDANTSPVELARECVARLTVTSDSPGNLIVIDDAQWIDEASQRVLRYVIPRVVRRRILLAFGVRTPHAPGSFGEFLVSACEDNPVDTAHELQPLTAREISALVLEQHGALIAADTAQRILDATGGTFLGVASVLAALPEREVSQSHLVWETDIRVKLDDASPLLHSFRNLDPAAQLTSELVCLAGHELTPQQLRNAAGLLNEPVELAPAIAADVLTQIGVT
ncbi:MAG: AAA family ATPase, partial [Leucobacter sp.]